MTPEGNHAESGVSHFEPYPCGESGERGREYLPYLIAIKNNTFSIEVLRASFFSISLRSQNRHR
jgi:hypothetical protein